MTVHEIAGLMALGIGGAIGLATVLTIGFIFTLEIIRNMLSR